MTPPETAKPPAVASALFKADTTTIAFAKQHDGTIRMTRQGWDEPKVLLAGESLEVRLFEGQVAAFRRAPPGKQVGPFPEGTTVYLKSGSPALVVEDFGHDGFVVVVWFSDYETHRDQFHPDALTTVDPRSQLQYTAGVAQHETEPPPEARGI